MRRWLAAVVLAGCGAADDPHAPSGDAGVDSGATGTVIPTAPAAPVLSPCPDGWREVSTEDGTVCDPWPEGGRAACSGAEAHFPGEPGCARIGTPCPADGWPVGLPVGVPVRYVRAGVPEGGDGSRARPFHAISTAAADTPAGTIIAVAPGTYDHYSVFLSDDVTLWGACPEETRIALTDPTGGYGVVKIVGEGTVLRNVTVGGGPGCLFVPPAAEPVSVHVEDVLFEGCGAAAISLASGALSGRSVIVRGSSAGAIETTAGTTVELERAVLADNTRGGILIDTGASASFTDVHVVGSSADSTGSYGYGITLYGRAELARTVIEDNQHTGIHVDRADGLVATDVIVRGTRAAPDGMAGGALDVASSDVTLTRVLLEQNRLIALWATLGSVVRAEDLVVRDTLAEEATGHFGRAIEVDGASTAEIDRAVLARNRDVALRAIGDGTVVTVHDVVVRDTTSDEEGFFGRAIEADENSRIVGERLQVERNRALSVSAFSGGMVELTDLTITGTLPRACIDSTCPDAGGGMGAGAYTGGHLALGRFLVSDNALCGLQLARDGTADLADGTVRNHPVGVNVQSEGFDIARLMNRVVYRDNDVQLDTTELPIPEP